MNKYKYSNSRKSRMNKFNSFFRSVFSLLVVGFTALLSLLLSVITYWLSPVLYSFCVWGLYRGFSYRLDLPEVDQLYLYVLMIFMISHLVLEYVKGQLK